MNRNYIENTLASIVFLESVCEVEPTLAEFKPSLKRFQEVVLNARQKVRATGISLQTDAQGGFSSVYNEQGK